MSQESDLPTKLSGVEALKQASRNLRGTIEETLKGDSDKFSEDEYQLLKFHGTYQGYDRDSATERKKQGLDKAWQMMIRARIPGGVLTPEQYLDLDAIADRYADGTVRITTRQSIQYHGVLKGNLKGLIADISRTLLTTLAACGDVVRNVMSTPAPIRDARHARIAADARLLSDALLPRSRAYHEIWLDGEKIETTEAEIEPLYGATYLPRKFKIAIATPEDNSVDVLTNDLGIIPLFDGDTLLGYNFALGGGLGMTHNKPQTYPRIATLVAFVEPDELLAAAEAVIKLHRDHGDRANRKHARLKYVIEEKGAVWAKQVMEGYVGHPLEDPRPMPKFEVFDHMGWHPQGDGNWYLGLPVSNGRVKDTPTVKLRSALRSIVAKHRPGIVLMPTQDILLADIAEAKKAEIEAELRAAGVDLAEDLLPVQRWAMACPALPTCGLALTEAERVREPLIERIAEVMKRYDLERERLSIRITGCPNGCARPYAGDIGLVGRMPGFYALYVGGDFEGTRLSDRVLEKVAESDVPKTLAPLFADFAANRDGREGFGDYCHRIGAGRVRELIGLAASAAAE